MATVCGDLGAAKAECGRVAGDVQRFLQTNGRTPPTESGEPIRLALFGQYNSGKSTLVNALFGQRVAVTGDGPETKIAQVYAVHGFEIADLPGGDARVQESEEALGALKSAHAVLYVVSSATGLDYDTTWGDLKLLVDRGIPFLVVVNDKQPHQDESTEQQFRQHLGEHFREVAAATLRCQNWTNRFFWVRATSAERGRIEHKEGLVLGSGIIPLEHALTSILRDCDATVRAAAHLRALQEALRSLRASLESASEAVEWQGVVDALQRCDMARSRLDAAAHCVAADHFGPLQDSISAVLRRAIAQSAGKEAAGANVADLVRDTYQGACTSFYRRCETELADLVARAEREIPSAAHAGWVEPTVHLGDVPTFAGQAVEPLAILRRFAAGATAVREALSAAKQTTAAIAGAEAVKAVGVGGGRVLAAQGANNAGAIVATQATKAAAQEGTKAVAKPVGKLFGPVVLIAIVAWEIWDGIQSASRERMDQELAVREAEAKAELAARTLHQQFLAAAGALVSGALAPVEKSFRDELKARSRSATDVAGKLATAGDLAARLATVTRALAGGMIKE